MPRITGEGTGDDGPFELLDLSSLTRGNQNWLEKILGDVSRQSVAKQIAIGGGTGWLAGYLFVKVGKAAAISLGSTVLLVQIAQHQGYLQINWSRVNREVSHARRRLQEEASRQYPGLARTVKSFVQENIFLAGSFAGGFLLGLAC